MDPKSRLDILRKILTEEKAIGNDRYVASSNAYKKLVKSDIRSSYYCNPDFLKNDLKSIGCITIPQFYDDIFFDEIA